MEVICVMDSSTDEAKFMEIKLACDDIPNLNLHHIRDIVSDNNQDLFFNADVAIVDMSKQDQWCKLSYNLGMRENYCMMQNIILFNGSESSQTFPLETANYIPLVKYTCNSDLQCVVDNIDSQTIVDNANVTDKRVLRQRIRELLETYRAQTKVHKTEKFLNDLLKASNTSSGDSLKKDLFKLKLRLADPDVVSDKTVRQLLLAFREIQEYNEMLMLVDELMKNPVLNFTLTPAITHLYGFALIRRNINRDVELAEKWVTSALQKEENRTQEMFCLCGRIYKDKFIQSGYLDKGSLGEAIHWYRTAFDFFQGELCHPGINLATLLIIDGKSFSNCTELQRIAMLLNFHLGRKGGFDKLDNYWDAATFFELNILMKNYSKAVLAALIMYKNKPQKWFLKTTMNNVNLIRHFQQKADKQELSSKELIFEFWIEFLTDGASSHSFTSKQFPILTVGNDGELTPSYISLEERSNEGSGIRAFLAFADPRNRSADPVILKSGDLKNFSLNKQDSRCLCLFLKKSEDMELYFSSQDCCNQFFHLLKDHSILLC